MKYHSTAIQAHRANPLAKWKGLLFLGLQTWLLTCLACSHPGALSSSASPSPLASASAAPPLPLSTPSVAEASASPAPRVRIDVPFGRPATPAESASPPGSKSAAAPAQVWISDKPLTALPPTAAAESYRLPGDTEEVFLGVRLPRRNEKYLIKASLLPPSGSAETDSQSPDTTARWAEFSFRRPASGWAEGTYEVKVEGRGRILAGGEVTFTAVPAVEATPDEDEER